MFAVLAYTKEMRSYKERTERPSAAAASAASAKPSQPGSQPQSQQQPTQYALPQPQQQMGQQVQQALLNQQQALHAGAAAAGFVPTFSYVVSLLLVCPSSLSCSLTCGVCRPPMARQFPWLRASSRPASRLGAFAQFDCKQQH